MFDIVAQCPALIKLSFQALLLYTTFLRDIMQANAARPPRPPEVGPRVFSIPNPDAMCAESALCVVGAKENALGFRKNRYAVRILDKTSVSTILKQTLIPVFKVDATLEGQTDIELFNRIRSKFTIQQCCVVIVSTRTNATISDVLFKWCAEFTRCNPWTYVIFHSLDVAWLATENQNR